MQQLKQRTLFRFDWLLFFCVMGLSLIGVVAIANAQTTNPQGYSGLREFIDYLNTNYARLHLIWIGMGLAAMGAAMAFDPRLYNILAHGLYWIIIALLAVAFLMPAIYGVSAWIQITENRTVQPAEFAKVAMIVMCSRQLAKYPDGIQRFRDLLWPIVYAAIPIVLVFAQQEAGSALVMVFIIAVMLFASKTNWRIMLALFIGAVVLGAVALYLLNEAGNFRIQRILSFFNQGEDITGANWNVYYSKMAVGSGGLIGKGLFQPGTLTSLNFVPQNHTDFIFSSWAEAQGLRGSLIILLLFIMVLYRELRVALFTRDRFSRNIVVGVIAMQFIHIFENIGMCIGVMPVMGIPLPFVSYGGTSMLTNMLCVGLVFCVGIRRDPNKSPYTLP